MGAITHEIKEDRFILSDRGRNRFIGMIVIGLILLGVGLLLAHFFPAEHHGAEAAHGAAAATDHAQSAGAHAGAGGGAGTEHHGPTVWTRLWANLWLNNVFFTGVALIGVFFLAVQYVAYAGWSVMVKRILEALPAYLWVGGPLMLLIFLFGHHDIFHWTHEGIATEGSANYDPIIAGKTGYLNQPFYYLRMVVYFIIWIGFWYLLRKESIQEDLDGNISHYKKSIKFSAVFLVLFGVTSSTSAWDWVLSIDTHWFSTMFGWYVFSSWFVSGLAATTLIAINLKQMGYLPFLNSNHLHDLGKFVFAFSIFWTYIWFSQFMLIWYANIPEESIYFTQRLGGWDNHYTWLLFVNLFVNFAFPFLVLMTRDAKRQMIMLKIVMVVVLAGHWSDFYLMVMPGTMKGEAGFGLIEIGCMLAFLGTFLLMLGKALSKANLTPINHPFLDESIHHTV